MTIARRIVAFPFNVVAIGGMLAAIGVLWVGHKLFDGPQL